MTTVTVTIRKVVRLGHDPKLGSTYIKISFDGRRLSISGVEGPIRNGNARGSCGQLPVGSPSPPIFASYAPDMTPALVEELWRIWDRWHLNDMIAGSPKQQEFLRKNNQQKLSYPEKLTLLEINNLNPDRSFDDYHYGSNWLFEPVPQDVLDFLVALPETDIQPAWI